MGREHDPSAAAGLRPVRPGAGHPVPARPLGRLPLLTHLGWSALVAGLLVTGLALAAVGTAALGLVGPSSTYLPGVALPMVLVGAGQGLAFGPLTASGIARVDRTQAGAASGVVSSVHQLGGALGMSLVLAVFGTYAEAMRDGAVLIALAVLTAAALVVPAAARRRRP